MKGKCAKREVKAFILGDSFACKGTNWCKNPQKVCPRKIGEGYEKCKSICKQNSHAEIEAIKKAGEEARGATMYVIGHDHICDECGVAIKAAGIRNVIIREAL
jgi:hypothetical protein